MKTIALLSALMLSAGVASAQGTDVTAATSQPVRVQTLVHNDGSSSLVHEVVIGAPISDVWPAISTLDGWKTWSVPLGWEIKGGRETWETSFDPAHKLGDAQNVRHVILARVPDSLFVFRTIKAPAGFRGGVSLPEVTWIVELRSVGDKATMVRITGAGFGSSTTGLAARAFFERANVVSFENLRRRFAQGPLDWGPRFKSASRP